jgi:hypothetical protein
VGIWFEQLYQGLNILCVFVEEAGMQQVSEMLARQAGPEMKIGESGGRTKETKKPQPGWLRLGCELKKVHAFQ